MEVNLDALETTFRKGHIRQSSAAKFEEIKRKDVRQGMNSALKKLVNTAPVIDQPKVQKEFNQFEALYSRFLLETGQEIEWDKIKPPPKHTVFAYDEFAEYDKNTVVNMLNQIVVVLAQVFAYDEFAEYDKNTVVNMLNQIVVVKFNGGLGTSMGCTGPKSAICVRNDQSFLDLNIQQIEHLNQQYGSDVPLVLMNSFNTEHDTLQLLPLYKQFNVKIYIFNQSRYPRINRSNYLPVPTSYTNPADEGWYPPGHGDIYSSLNSSGLLDQFIKENKRYIFVSNIDNMGATVDLNILHFLLNPAKTSSPEFVMEVTDKTRADVKGGTLVEYENKIRLLEIAQVPKDKVDEFKSVCKFKIFNTNNLWISLNAIKRVMDEGSLHMEIIVNPKTMADGTNVIQLETAAGAAIKNFDSAIGINVPRRRFMPVKMTSDLLIVMSNLYSLQKASLVMSPLRSFPSVPLVKLGTHFNQVKEFLRRFADIPDILELDHLTVSGDVTFGKNVTIKGTVIIIANHGDRIDIPPGAILENKIVSGNLRILDH